MSAIILVSASQVVTSFPASSTRDHSGSTAIWRPIGDPGPRAIRRYRKVDDKPPKLAPWKSSNPSTLLIAW